MQGKRVLLLLETSRAWGRGIMRGIGRYSRIHGPWKFTIMPREYLALTEKEMQGIKSELTKNPVDGVISFIADENRFWQCVPKDLPTICVPILKEKVGSLPCIIHDSKTIGQMTAEHLLDCGFKRFAYVGEEDHWSINYSKHYTRRIEKAGYSVERLLLPRYTLSSDWESKRQILLSWLSDLPKPIGVMACNDDYSKNIVDLCKDAGIKMPEEVAIVGVDNDSLICDLCDMPLSSVALNFERAGYETAQLLEKMMGGYVPQGDNIYVHPHHVVKRNSTDVLAIDNENVAGALRYIRQNAREKISVSDVVENSSISRCELYKAFADVLGCTIHDEIIRVRMNLVKKMLIETDMTVSQIAYVLGENSDKHISRVFKKHTGYTPLGYRKLYGHNKS